jgi:hypothetical protein
MKRYQQNKLELARIEALHDLQQERLIDLHTGDISQEDYDKLQQKIIDKLAQNGDLEGVKYCKYAN